MQKVGGICSSQDQSIMEEFSTFNTYFSKYQSYVHVGGQGHFHIGLHGMCCFSGYHFSVKIPELG